MITPFTQHSGPDTGLLNGLHPKRFPAAVFLVAVLLACTSGLPADPPPHLPEGPVVLSGKAIPAKERVVVKAGKRAPLSARQIILEAHLDDRLTTRLQESDAATGKADGKLAVSDYVMFLNAREVINHIQEHGFRSYEGPVEIRSWRGRQRIQVRVRITAGDGSTVDALLESDGSLQGAG